MKESLIYGKRVIAETYYNCPRCKGEILTDGEFGNSSSDESTIGIFCENVEDCGYEEDDPEIVSMVHQTMQHRKLIMKGKPSYSFIGIDPGVNGAIAWCSEWIYDMKCMKCPSDPQKMVDSLTEIWTLHKLKGGEEKNIFVGLEKVWARPANAVRAAFKFGTNYGQWQGALHGIGINQICYPTPRAWQKEMGIKKGMDKADRKRKIKSEMQNLFPDIKVTLINADAIAIARFIAQNGWEDMK